MELHEAILHLKRYQGYIPFNDEHGMMKHAFDLTDETVDTILAALSGAENTQAQATDQPALFLVGVNRGMSFENFLTEHNDEIYNAAHALLCALSKPDLEWDMEKIGSLVDDAETLLAERGIETCYPYYEGEDEIPCIKGSDCKNRHCAYRACKGA